jgi:hypothetical protein
LDLGFFDTRDYGLQETLLMTVGCPYWVSDNRPPTLWGWLFFFGGEPKVFLLLKEKLGKYFFSWLATVAACLAGGAAAAAQQVAAQSAHWVPLVLLRAAREFSSSCRAIRVPWSTIEVASLLGLPTKSPQQVAKNGVRNPKHRNQ